MVFNNLGMSLLLKGDYGEAVKSFTEALKLETSNSKIHNNLALALCRLGRYPEALEVFKKGGDEASAYNNLGYLYMTEGKYKEAIEAFENALEIKPGFYLKAYENLRKAKAAYLTPSQ
jgi:Flp pilus assembly protein TadD